MIQIKNLNFATLSLESGEMAIIGQKLTAFQEHQICMKILKMLLADGIQGDIMTDAKLNEEVV